MHDNTSDSPHAQPDMHDSTEPREETHEVPHEASHEVSHEDFKGDNTIDVVDTEQGGEGGDTSALIPMETLHAIDVDVRFELAQLHTTVGALQTLAVGQRFTIPKDATQHMALKSMGVTLAEAKLVSPRELGTKSEALIVEITKRVRS